MEKRNLPAALFFVLKEKHCTELSNDPSVNTPRHYIDFFFPAMAYLKTKQTGTITLKVRRKS